MGTSFTKFFKKGAPEDEPAQQGVDMNANDYTREFSSMVLGGILLGFSRLMTLSVKCPGVKH